MGRETFFAKLDQWHPEAVESYCRYHDDIFMAIQNARVAKDVLEPMADAVATSHRLELDAISTNGVRMLDPYI